MSKKKAEKEKEENPIFIYLGAKDGRKIKVRRKYVKEVGLIKDMFEVAETDYEDEEIPDNFIIPLPNAPYEALEKLVEYYTHHWGNEAERIPKPIFFSLDDYISTWDKSFLDDLDIPELIQLILCANYVNAPELLNLCTAKVGSMLLDNNPEQIRKTFGIVNDHTPKEEKIIKQEGIWCSLYK